MALVTWATIFPLLTLVVLVIGPWTKGLALAPRLAITTAVTVPIMIWIVIAPGLPPPAQLALPAKLIRHMAGRRQGVLTAGARPMPA